MFSARAQSRLKSLLRCYLLKILGNVSDRDEVQVETATRIYDEFMSKGLEPIFDDRSERPGIKFKDMELIGIPYRITVGRGAKDGIVEIKPRVGDAIEVKVEDVFTKVTELLNS